jgi:tetratricopeptide (TPR) repeat protein
MLNLTIFLIIIVSFAIILIVIYRKIPLLKTIDLDAVIEVKEKKKKYWLLEQRLKRQFFEVVQKVKLNQLGDRISAVVKSLKLVHLSIKRKKIDYIKEKELANGSVEVFDEQTKLNQLETLMKQGNLIEAENLIIEIVKKSPKNLEAYRLLSEIYTRNKEWQHTEATLEHVIKLANRLHKVLASDYLKLGAIKLELGKNEEALQNGRQAAMLEPLNPKCLYFYVKVCILCKEKDLAWKHYRKLKEVNGENEGLDVLLEELKRI